MKELLKLENIKKSFFSLEGETKVIENFSLCVYEDEIVSLIGPSGCGKSTILNLIAKLEPLNEGTITYNCDIGYMFQKDNLLPWLTVYKNVILGLEITKKLTKSTEKYALSLLEKYGLDKFATYYPEELSGGMRQRVALIRTLCLKPKLLLLDEPFSALDSQTRLFVQEDVKKIIKEEKLSSLLVTHDISEAIALSDRIIVLSIRPLEIKKEIKLDFKNKMPSSRRKDNKFSSYFNDIFNTLHY